MAWLYFQSVKNCWELKLWFRGPQINSFVSIPWLLINAPLTCHECFFCLLSFPPSYLTFECGCITLFHIIERLKINKPLNNLRVGWKLSNSKFQIHKNLQGWPLNLSFRHELLLKGVRPWVRESKLLREVCFLSEGPITPGSSDIIRRHLRLK